MAAPAGVGGRAVGLLVAVLFSADVGLVAFILRTRLGARATEAALWAGSAFGGSVALTLAASVFLLK
ncbi:hypothetical protein ACFXAF_00580 [Kitasatospora sp. NPDC059463]|uniref:hypothetical protein n=1 Tax=unclassified Kitasatospora TaxID=2633591 RepID=UPI00368BF027